MASGPIISWEVDEKNRNSDRLFFLVSKIIADGDCSHEIKRRLFLERKAMTNLDSILKAETLLCWQRFIKSKLWYFPVLNVLMWELDHKEGWAPKNLYFQTVVLEKSPLDSREIKPVNPKGNQPWIFIGRSDAGTEAPILRSPDAKSPLLENLDAGKDWRQDEKAKAPEDEMVGWHHWLNEHEFEQTLGNNKEQGSLPCCVSWGHKELDTT